VRFRIAQMGDERNREREQAIYGDGHAYPESAKFASVRGYLRNRSELWAGLPISPSHQ